MGAVSSCCSDSASEAPNKQYLPPEKESPRNTSEKKPKATPKAQDGAGPDKSDKSQRSHAKEIEFKNFKNRMKNGIEISVLLQDGTSLSCKMKLMVDPPILQVSFEEKVRNITFDEIKSLLYGFDALKRVETRAALTDDDRCVALQLVNGNCIPVKFRTSNDKRLFIDVVSDIMHSACRLNPS
eukprot:Filipodium_phascolosomae@DN7099_c0_g1_i1.p1